MIFYYESKFKIFFFVFLWTWGGGATRLNEYYTKNPNLKKKQEMLQYVTNAPEGPL